MAKIPHSKIKISLELAVLNIILFETVTQISRSTNPDVFVDNMKRNSDLQSTWSSCVIQMLNRQARVKGAVRNFFLKIEDGFQPMVHMVLKFIYIINKRIIGP